MNDTELRTRAALQRLAEGVRVDQLDLDRLEADILDRVHDRRASGAPRTRAWQWAVAACAVLGVVLGGLALWKDRPSAVAPPAQQPTKTLQLSALVGLWRAQAPDSGWLWEFHSDGTIAWANSSKGYLGPQMRGTAMRLTDSGFVMLGGDCRFTSSLTITGPDTLAATAEPEACNEFQTETFNLERVPVSKPAGAGYQSLAAQWNTAEDVRTMDLVDGAWLDPATGRLVVVAPRPDGKGYDLLIDDDGDGGLDPDLRGSAALTKDGVLELTPDRAHGRGCVYRYGQARTDNAHLWLTALDSGSPRSCTPSSTQTWLRLS